MRNLLESFLDQRETIGNLLGPFLGGQPQQLQQPNPNMLMQAAEAAQHAQAQQQAVPPLPAPVNIPQQQVADLSQAVDPMQTGAMQQPMPQSLPQPQAMPQQTPQSKSGGFFDGLSKFGESDFGQRLTDMFHGWGMGSTMQDSLSKGTQMIAAGNQGRKDKKSQFSTIEWLKGKGMDEDEAKYLAGNSQALTAYLQSIRKSNDPMQALNQRKMELEIQRLESPQDKPTTLMQNLQAAGLRPGTPEYQQAILDGAKGGVNVDARTMGSVPQGYRVIYDQNKNPISMEPIAGGPADTSRADAVKSDNLAASTDVVTGAAQKARGAFNSAYLPVTGTLGKVASIMPETGAAEVRRQVETLKANAKMENLQAMRSASPTGGALGAVSDSENAMLAAKAGAIDPDSPNFLRDLDDYERSVLRVIHGKDAGDRIYGETRGSAAGGGRGAPQAPQSGVIDSSDYFKQ